MSVLNFTHANLNRAICINSTLLFSWYKSDTGGTMLLSPTGGAIPVKESVEQVTALFNNNDLEKKGKKK